MVYFTIIIFVLLLKVNNSKLNTFKAFECVIKYELFTTISVALLKCAPPIVVNNFRKVAPLVSKQPASADNMSILYTIVVRHSKSLTEIVWKMS